MKLKSPMESTQFRDMGFQRFGKGSWIGSCGAFKPSSGHRDKAAQADSWNQ